MKQRVFYLLKTYLLTVVLFMVAKPCFMLYNTAGHPFAFTDVFQVLYHGLSLDLSTALYLLIIPFLTAVVSIFAGGAKSLRLFLKGYYVLIAVALVLAFVADTSLYEFWGFKLDASCLQYLETPTEAMASVSWGYLLLRLFALILLGVLFYWLFTHPRFDIARSRHRILESCCALVLIPLMVIGIRGGLDESTTNIGQVYYSDNQFLNHAAVNPVFNFFASFEKSASHIVDYDYYTQQECDQLMDGLYPAAADSTISLLTTKRPDIVVILMESAGEIFSEAMPNLQRLKHEGVNFSKCYANSWRTDRGTVCTYSGYPSFPTSSVMKMPKKTHGLPSIARTLQREGYHTTYIYGGDINFTNMRSYLVASGFSRLVWKKDYSRAEQQTSEWGVRDDITFDTLYQLLTTGQSPQFIGFSTLSSHQPWDVPIHQYDDEVLNAFCYLDQCIGRFIDKLKQTDRWANTLIVLLPDHSMDGDGIDQSHPRRNLIPMVWTGGAVSQPFDVSTICNQTDMAATLLAQLGLPADDFKWSRNVLGSNYRYPFAFHTYNNGFSLVDSTGFMAYDLDSRKVIADTGSDATRLERMGKAILQSTTKDLKDL
jgi:phosphoglycerol transferase MdoB-like AlkP superfamily enzyme